MLKIVNSCEKYDNFIIVINRLNCFLLKMEILNLRKLNLTVFHMKIVREEIGNGKKSSLIYDEIIFL